MCNLLVIWLVCCTLCYVDTRTLKHKVADTLKVDVIRSTPSKTKRHAELPLSLSVRVTSDHATSNLRLIRSPYMPVFQIKNGVKTPFTDFKKINAAIYADRSKRAAFIVNRALNRYHFEGSLDHGSEMINIHHNNARSKRHAIDEDVVHEITAVDPVSSKYTNELLRVKRDSSSYILELTFISDAEDYSNYIKLFNHDETSAMALMTLHYMFIEHQMQIRFDSVQQTDPNFKITLSVAELVVVKDRRQSTYTENFAMDGKVDAIMALNKASDWVASPAGGITFKPTDHYMFFTGYDLITNGNSTTTGQTFPGKFCQVESPDIFSVSLVENTRAPAITGHWATHKLGYALNAGHDGNASTTCTDSNYVIGTVNYPDVNSAYPASNPYSFSPCSVSAMKEFLERADVVCDSDNRYGDGMLSTNLRAGQMYDADSQCRTVYGKLSFFCRSIYLRSTVGYGNMCNVGYCFNPSNSFCEAIVFDEYTSCGDKKWCIKGKCIADADAPSRPSDQCPQFDSPGRICIVNSCPLYRGIESGECCGTCVPQEPSTSPTSSPASTESSSQEAPETPTTTQPTVAVTEPKTTATSQETTQPVTPNEPNTEPKAPATSQETTEPVTTNPPNTSPTTSVTEPKTSPTSQETTQSQTTRPSAATITPVTNQPKTFPTQPVKPTSARPRCTLLRFVNRECNTPQYRTWYAFRQLLEQSLYYDDDSDESDSDESFELD